MLLLPFSDEMLSAGVSVALADKLVQTGELSVSSGAKLAGMPYALYLQHLGSIAYSMIEADEIEADLKVLQTINKP